MNIVYRLSEKHWEFCTKVPVNVSIPIEWINDTCRRYYFCSFSFRIFRVILSLTSCIDQDITQSAFARIVRNYTTEGDQVDADNDFNDFRRAATSSSPGTYAADFYDPSIPLSSGLHLPPPKYGFTLARYTSRRRQCCNHCATRVETRDHQRSLSLTNRIWHRPNRPRGSAERVGEHDARAMSL